METLTTKSTYTYEDYAQLPEGAPYQLIEGQLVMAPSPRVYHQLIVGALYRALHAHVHQHDLGEVFVAPVDVYLSETTTLVPDVIFVAAARRAIIGEMKIEGAPDLVMEVLSPSTAYYDLKEKKRLYEQHGVREYWLVDPEADDVEIYRLDEDQGENQYALHQRAVETGAVTSALLDGFAVDLADLFDHPTA
jgi:Uma2 family endonuclease